MDIEFNGERLRLARFLKGCTLQEVGDAVCVSRQYIHQFESGARVPPRDVIGALSEYLQVTPGFFHNSLAGEVKPEQCHFRKRKTTPVGMANRVMAYSTVLEALVKKLHSYLDLPENRFREFYINDVEELNPAKIELLAERVREKWGLTSDAPIDNMVDVLENSGAVVTYFDSVSDKVDALSVDRLHPIVIRSNAKASVCRMRFDLAHECGHLIMHKGIETGDPKTEREADAFASAFLFPRQSFAREFQKCIGKTALRWPEIYKLKLRWKVSVRAIIYRAHFLGMIDAQQYRSANVYLNRTRQARIEKYDERIPGEEPSVLRDSIELLGSDCGISVQMLSENLGVYPSTLAEVTGISFSESEIAKKAQGLVPLVF